MQLDFLVTAPPVYQENGCDADQSFSAIVPKESFQFVDGKDFLVEEINNHLEEEKKYYKVGLNITPQIAKLAPLNDSGYQVPLILHYNGGYIRLKIQDDLEFSVKYDLPEKYFPRVDPGPKWELVGVDGTNLCTSKLKCPTEELIEEWEYVGKNMNHVFFSEDYSVAICACIKIACTKDKHPLAYYVDQIYSLKSMILYIESSIFDSVKLE